MSRDSYGTRDDLVVGGQTYGIHRLDRVDGAQRLPYSLKVLLESLLCNEDGRLGITGAETFDISGITALQEDIPAAVHVRAHAECSADG